MATIRKRGNTYEIVIPQGIDLYGKQVRHYRKWEVPDGMTPAAAKKEAQRQAFLFEEEVKQGGIVRTSEKFQEFAERWFTEGALRLKETARQSYRSTTKRTYKAIGHLRLDKITTRDVQRFIGELLGAQRNDRRKSTRPLNPKTVLNYISFISTVFDYAARLGYVSANPCEKVILPRIERARRQNMLTPEQVQILLDRLVSETRSGGSVCAMFLIIAIYSGFRRGELLGLEWQDFDFELQTVCVNRASYYTPEMGIFTDTPKTQSAYRFVKLPPELFELLGAFKARREAYANSLGDKWQDSDRLFTSQFGKPLYPNTPYDYFHRICQILELPTVSLHSLRHFNISMLISAGLDPKIVQYCAGHSEATTTLNIYAHTFAQTQAKALIAVTGVLHL